MMALARPESIECHSADYSTSYTLTVGESSLGWCWEITGCHLDERGVSFFGGRDGAWATREEAVERGHRFGEYPFADLP